MPTAGEQKERIISLINSHGPILPVRVASELKLEPLFASAFLSELYGERRIRISNLRVGGSPLYYIAGQEAQLENFVQHLNQRERDAFLQLKDKKALDDEKESPVMRVALRAIKDFAIPLKDPSQPQKILWRYHQISEQEAIQIISHTKQEKKKEEIIIEAKEEIVAQAPQQIEKKVQPAESAVVQEQKPEKPKRPRAQKKQVETQQEFSLSIHHVQHTTPFSEEAKAFLEKSGYGVQALISADKKECMFKASLQGPHGMQTYLVIAKDKRKVKQEEIVAALEEAHKQRLLCLVLARGELDKKTSTFAASWSNFLAYKAF